MTNLLKETENELECIGKTPNDIARIGSYDGEHGCTWEEFKELADIEYDSGYGIQKVATDLIILFRDGTWLERKEYDGSEWWSYVTPPDFNSLFDIPNEIESLQGRGYLSHIHGDEEE